MITVLGNVNEVLSNIPNGSGKFRHISTKIGLSQNTVLDIFQDRHGYIWVGTQEGLNRFDGREIRTFTHLPSDTSTLSNNVIYAITEDVDGNLWIATSKGLNRIDVKTQKITRVPLYTINGNAVKKIYSLLSLEDGTLLIGTDGIGLLAIDTKSDLFPPLILSNFDIIANADVRTIYQDSRSRIWIGTDESGVWLADSVSDIPVNFAKSDSKTSISHNRIRSFWEDSQGRIWIGTRGGGLNRFDETSQYFYHYKHNSKSPSTISNNRVYDILEDDHSRLWIATDSGLNILDPSVSKFIRIKHNPSQPSSLSHDRVLSLIKSQNGLIWLGTMAGLNYWDPVKAEFTHYRNISEDNNSLSNNTIYGFTEDNKGGIYVATFGGGLNYLDTTENKWSTLKTDDNGQPLNLNNRIMSLMVDSKQRLWIGSFSSGVKVLSSKHKVLKNFENESNNDSSLSANGITDIFEDSDGDIWIATYAAGVNRLNSDQKSFTRYLSDVDSDRFGNVSVMQILEDNQGFIWFATDGGGIFRLNKHTNELINIVNDANNESLSDNSIYSVYQDKKGRFWVGSKGHGLARWEPENMKYLKNVFQKYTISNGLPSSTINGIVEDEQGYIWISTNKGASRLDPETDQFIHYNLASELHENEFNQGAMMKSSDQRLYFGGLNGISAFYPNEITPNLNKPKVVLTEILSENKVVKTNESLNTLEQIKFDYRDYLITFEFAALDYSQPEKNQYQYKLEGFDPYWINSNTLNRATYTNLPSGHYIFKAKGSNNDGVWSDESINLSVIILPAPWETWWAFSIYVFCSILLLLYIFNKRTDWLKKRAAELENTISLRTTELATEKEKVEQLLSRKNEEFANVSHEFRTPLTLILGPINQLVAKSKDKNLVGKLNIVQRNALRMLRMVDQLLNLETFRVKAITQKSPQAIGKITQLVAEAFADLAEEKQITFNIETIEPVCFDFTPDAFEKIILNLLSNAIKYTKPGGTISISATRYEDNRYQIQVSDTGIGIAKDKLEKVFERFNRVMDENSEQVTGSGIGLALVKSLVESHDGSVELESELGQGTTITVTLPIINEVDESQINVHQNDEIIAMELMNVSSSGLHESSIAQSAETIQSAGKPTVLVIEDNDDMRQYIVESIGQQFNTLVASDGQAGLELAIQEVPDLIISDIMMPKLDGYQTTKALREAQITNHIPVVLLTARGDRDSRLKGWEEKADEYITKPFDVEELIIRISNLIEIRNILKRRFSETVFEQTEQALESSVQEMDSDSENLSIVEINTQKLQQEFINQLNQQIESVYMNADLGVIDLAKSVNMSERQFYRKLKSVIDMTPSEYLRRFRLEKSKEVLRSGKTANFTAFEVGFSSQAYFSKCFKAQYNLTPKQFVNQK